MAHVTNTDLADALRGLSEGLQDIADRFRSIAESIADTVPDQVSPLRRFLEERAEVAPGLRCRSNLLFHAYNAWAVVQDQPQFEAHDLRDMLAQMGHPKMKSDGRMVYKGFSLDPSQ